MYIMCLMLLNTNLYWSKTSHVIPIDEEREYLCNETRVIMSAYNKS